MGVRDTRSVAVWYFCEVYDASWVSVHCTQCGKLNWDHLTATSARYAAEKEEDLRLWSEFGAQGGRKHICLLIPSKCILKLGSLEVSSKFSE